MYFNCLCATVFYCATVSWRMRVETFASTGHWVSARQSMRRTPPACAENGSLGSAKKRGSCDRTLLDNIYSIYIHIYIYIYIYI